MQTKTETKQCIPEEGRPCEYNDGNCCIWGTGKAKFIIPPKGKNMKDCKLIKKDKEK